MRSAHAPDHEGDGHRPDERRPGYCDFHQPEGKYPAGVQNGDSDPRGVIRVRAPNPSPLTLDGTNTYVVGAWVVDPGPADAAHLAAVWEASDGSIEGIVLTHGHADHASGAEPLAERAGGAPVLRPAGGEQAGPFAAVATPGHSADSVCLLLDRVCFTGDTVLGEGSVFIQPGEGSLSAYLDSLRALRELDLEVLCPGHGPVRPRPAGKARRVHRAPPGARAAAARGARRRRPHRGRAARPRLVRRAGAAAARGGLTLRAHLEKLREEGRLDFDPA